MEIVKEESKKAQLEEKPSYKTEEDARGVKARKYDPNKNYRWSPETQFTLSGDEFGATLNAFRKILTSPEAQTIFATERAHFLLTEALVRAVERGDAVESTPEKK